MRIYKTLSDGKSQSEREGRVSPDDKENNNTVEILPFIPKKFENDIFNLKITVGEENFYQD